MNRRDRLIRRKNAGLDRQALRRDDLDDLATMTAGERMRACRSTNPTSPLPAALGLSRAR
jgi:hypothetical protein